MPHVVALAAASEVGRRRRAVRSHSLRFQSPALKERTDTLARELPPDELQGGQGCIIAIALVRDLVRMPHPADLCTDQHRLMRQSFLRQSIGLTALLWTSVLRVAILAESFSTRGRPGSSGVLG